MKKYELPDLPYDYNALEPVISAEIMQLHHQKHHAGYVNNLNIALEKYALAPLEEQVTLLPAINFNGGGHINHSIFWTNLTPGGSELHKGGLKDKIEKEWGSLDHLIEAFNAKTVAIQGSGWGWLAACKKSGCLKIMTTANQDPLCTTGLVPVLGIDVWEHAYYLQYKNARIDYLKNIWKVINWKNVAERYNSCTT